MRPLGPNLNINLVGGSCTISPEVFAQFMIWGDFVPRILELKGYEVLEVALDR